MNYKTKLIENTWTPKGRKLFSTGWGNGYVLIPKDHPFHGVDYDTINKFVNVHGGLTYSDSCTSSVIQSFGLEDEDQGKWMIGFDTAHSGDNEERWHKAAVQAETDCLLAQVMGCASLTKEEVIHEQN